MKSFYQDLIDVPEPRERFVRMVGDGSSGAPTVGSGGAGMTLSRAGAGDYKITFDENPGTYCGIKSVALQSATGSDVKNYSVTFIDWDATNLVLEVLVFNGSGVATDLTTAQSLSVTALFKNTSLTI